MGGVLAIVLHPVFMFFYCFLFLVFSEKALSNLREGNDFWKMSGIIFFLTVLLPGLFPVFYARDAFLFNRQKRPLTLFFTLVCYGLCLLWILMSFTNISSLSQNQSQVINLLNSRILIKLLIYLIVGLFALGIISFWYKISLHANGVGFLLALPFMPGLPWMVWIINFNHFLSLSAILVVLLCCGILLWQRISSGAHTLLEVVSGFAAGFGITILMETLLR